MFRALAIAIALPCSLLSTLTIVQYMYLTNLCWGLGQEGAESHPAPRAPMIQQMSEPVEEGVWPPSVAQGEEGVLPLSAAQGEEGVWPPSVAQGEEGV